MSEIKTTENGLEIQANKITLEGPETKYITLAVVEYDPYEGMDCEGNDKDKTLVRLPTFCHQVNRGDLITFKTGSSSKPFQGKVLAKQTYNVEDDYLPMLLLAFNQDLGCLPTIEVKIEEVRVTW
ncbi:hypothetical protein SAMN05216431_10233 [Ligilactobacillus sp. WC1T17]|uniref:Uncharacterized protein n=1 Tax=Ligilactobacillus ruminis TaxID=1623 RepID=A0ABY1A9F6_9LACO|nr:hypothetical protein SAMN05216431_10233 [Ligilactobacillus ruminis]